MVVVNAVAVDLREADAVGVADVLVENGEIEGTEGREDCVVEHNRQEGLVSRAWDERIRSNVPERPQRKV